MLFKTSQYGRVQVCGTAQLFERVVCLMRGAARRLALEALLSRCQGTYSRAETRQTGCLRQSLRQHTSCQVA